MNNLIPQVGQRIQHYGEDIAEIVEITLNRVKYKILNTCGDSTFIVDEIRWSYSIDPNKFWTESIEWKLLLGQEKPI